MKKLLALLLTLCMLIGITSFAVAEAPVEITWWVFPTFGQDDGNPPGTYEQSVVDAFEAKYSNISVTVETIDFTAGPDKLTSNITGGTAPDVLFDAPGRIIEYGKNGVLVPLDDLFTDEMIADVNNDALIGACSDGANYWMYPISSSPFFMSINKDVFEETGAIEFVNTEGDRTWTTENFLKALDKLHEGGKLSLSVYCGGQGGDQGTRALVSNLYGAKIANDDQSAYTMNSEEGIKALTLLQQLATEGKIEVGTDIAAADEIELYKIGTLAMSICWGTSAAKNHATDAFTQFSLPFPSESGTPALEYLVNGFCIFDNKDDARAEAAKTFLKFICDDAEWGPKNVVQTGAFPVRSSFGDLYAGNDEYTLYSSWTKYYAPYYNTMNGFANMRTEWWNMLQRVFNGEDPATALNTYVNNSNAGM